VNNSIEQFLSSLLITSRLLPEKVFNERINSSIEENKSNAPQTFSRLLILLRSINDGNGLISTYGTNFQYLTVPDLSNKPSLPTRAIIYDNGCSCGLSSNCTSPGNFVQITSSELIEVKGLKMGCTPSESFLRSTLECFYDSSCINIIQNETNELYVPQPILANTSRFLMNTSIIDLVNVLFIENWSTTINYLSYFDHCLPSLCSYRYIQKINSFYTITLLLSLYGGLSVVLKWICPLLVLLGAKIYSRWKKRTNIIEPVSIISTTNTILYDTNVRIVTVQLESTPTVSSHSYFFSFFSLFMILYRCLS
jgi:hypothetical protein